MPSRDPERRRIVNAAYYDRVMADPERKRARREAERRRRKNKDIHDATYYERNRVLLCWVDRLERMLLAIRRAEIARGRVPYDG